MSIEGINSLYAKNQNTVQNNSSGNNFAWLNEALSKGLNGTDKAKNDELMKGYLEKNINNIDPQTFLDNIVKTMLGEVDPKFLEKPEKEQAELIKNKKIEILKKLNPDLKLEGKTAEQQEKILNRYEFCLQSACYALKTGKINDIRDYKKLSNKEKAKIQYEFTKSVPAEKRTKSMQLVFDRGELLRKIATDYGFTSIDEYFQIDAGDQLNMKYNYLKSHKNELNDYEKRELQTMENILEAYKSSHGKDPDGEFCHMEFNTDATVEERAFFQDENGEEIDITDHKNHKILFNKAKKSLDGLQGDERKDAIEKLYRSAGSIQELEVVTRIVMMLSKDNTVSAEEVFEANKSAGNSSHIIVANSANEEITTDALQAKSAEIVAEECQKENGEYTAYMASGFIENVTPKYCEAGQIATGKAFAPIENKIITESLASTMPLYSENAVKNIVEFVINNNDISDAQKQILISKTLQNLPDGELKNELKAIAEKAGIDYKRSADADTNVTDQSSVKTQQSSDYYVSASSNDDIQNVNPYISTPDALDTIQSQNNAFSLAIDDNNETGKARFKKFFSKGLANVFKNIPQKIQAKIINKLIETKNISELQAIANKNGFNAIAKYAKSDVQKNWLCKHVKATDSISIATRNEIEAELIAKEKNKNSQVTSTTTNNNTDDDADKRLQLRV